MNCQGVSAVKPSQSKTDYHIFLRNISDVRCDCSFGENPWLKELSEASEQWRQWFSEYAGELQGNSLPDHKRKKLVGSVNPRYVLRNHIMETAIKEALEQENYPEDRESKKRSSKTPSLDQPEHMKATRPPLPIGPKASS